MSDQCRLVLLLGCLLCASSLQLAGCASGASARANTATGGLELRMFVRDDTGAESLYQVNRDGTLNFGGGFNALAGHTTWTGQMTPQEIQELRELIETHHWFTANPDSTQQPPGMLYRVAIDAPQVQKHFTVKGESPDAQPVRELLARIALRRLEGELKRLPQPSLQPSLKPGEGIPPGTTTPATMPR